MSARFSIPHLLSVRPAGGGDLALLVENGPDHLVGRRWDGTDRAGVSEVLPFPVSLDAILSPDGAWVVDLDDDGGSEVGGLVARSVDGGVVVPLTPDLGPYGCAVSGRAPTAQPWSRPSSTRRASTWT